MTEKELRTLLIEKEQKAKDALKKFEETTEKISKKLIEIRSALTN